MPPGTDVGGTNRPNADGSMGLRPANGKHVGEKNDNTTAQAPALSARERLRLHVNRNLALQQDAGKGGGRDQGPSSAGGPPAPPRGASPANSSTPPPTSAQPLTKFGRQNKGLDSLYGPITDTRLGRGDISQGPNSAGSTAQTNSTISADGAPPVLSPVLSEMLHMPLNMSIDMGDSMGQSSPLGQFADTTPLSPSSHLVFTDSHNFLHSIPCISCAFSVLCGFFLCLDV